MKETIICRNYVLQELQSGLFKTYSSCRIIVGYFCKGEEAFRREREVYKRKKSMCFMPPFYRT